MPHPSPRQLSEFAPIAASSSDFEASLPHLSMAAQALDDALLAGLFLNLEALFQTYPVIDHVVLFPNKGPDEQYRASVFIRSVSGKVYNILDIDEELIPNGSNAKLYRQIFLAATPEAIPDIQKLGARPWKEMHSAAQRAFHALIPLGTAATIRTLAHRKLYGPDAPSIANQINRPDLAARIEAAQISSSAPSRSAQGSSKAL